MAKEQMMEQEAAMADQKQAPQGQQPSPEQMTQLVQSVGQGLSVIAQMIGNAPAAKPEDKKVIADILSMYMSLIERNMGDGEEPMESEQESAPVSMMQGSKGVPMSPQMRG